MKKNMVIKLVKYLRRKWKEKKRKHKIDPLGQEQVGQGGDEGLTKCDDLGA